MKLIVTFNKEVSDLKLQKQIKEKINKFNKDNLGLFGWILKLYLCNQNQGKHLKRD